MSESAAPASPDPAVLEQQISDLRRGLVAAELEILELKDQLEAKETDRADAVALLGQAELVLEQKIGYIMTLDQALNQRIRDLETECDRKTEEIDRRGEAINATRAEGDRQREERDKIIQDLSQKLETANQEISKAHDLARDFAEKLESTRQELAQTEARRAETEARRAETATALQEARDEAAENAQARDSAQEESANRADEINRLTAELSQTQEQLALAEGRLRAVFNSTLWRWGRPWRALFGPKL